MRLNIISKILILTLSLFISFNTLQSEEIFIDSSEFQYAGTKRYSISGELPYEETNIKTGYFVGVTALTTAFMISQHIYQANTIWKDQAEFKVIEDGQYALYADKAGHIFGGYYLSYLYTDFLASTGINWELSNILGAAVGLTYQTYIEILDGYGENFGFSPSDMYANAFGAGFFLAKHYVPYLQNFTPKFTYFPADWHGENKRRPHFAFIDDYSSHTLWMSMNVHNMLPEDYSKYWPKWLQLSVGYAVRNLCDPFDPSFDCSNSYNVNSLVNGDRKVILALDYNLPELLPEMGPPFDWIIQSLNYIKWPAPAIEFGRETKFMLIYPFVEF